MAKTKGKKRASRSTSATAHLVRTVGKAALAIALAMALILALVWMSNRAGQSVAKQPRYTVRIADLQMDLPPYLDRQTLLAEVRFLSELPETIQIVDPNTPEVLQQALDRHPWIRSVRQIQIRADGSFYADLEIRTPVLALLVSGESQLRAVDQDGVLLPLVAPTQELPLYENWLLPASVVAGEVWPDRDVHRAIELTRFYPTIAIERTKSGWIITQPGGSQVRIANP